MSAHIQFLFLCRYKFAQTWLQAFAYDKILRIGEGFDHDNAGRHFVQITFYADIHLFILHQFIFYAHSHTVSA